VVSAIGSPEVSGRLDDEKLETLRSWGAGLAAGGSDELRAAGKAILILVEEIERLQVDVWHARDGSTEARRAASDDAGSEAIRDEQVDEPRAPPRLEPTLRGRIRRLLGARNPEAS
jgi:hypothetical protein